VASFQIKNLKEDCTSALTLLKGVKWPKPQQAQQAQQAPPQGPVGMGGVGGALNPAPAPAVGSQQPVLARQGSPLIALLMAALGAGKAYPARRLTLAACRCLSDLVVPRRSGSSGAGVAAVKTRHGIVDIAARTEKRVVTTGCGQGSVFGDLMGDVDSLTLPDARISQARLYGLLNAIRLQESTYKSAGSVHGCALFKGEHMQIFVEDVGRHNAIDTIAGWMWMNGVPADADSIFYTTGRLTSEMVIKSAQMGVAVAVSRSGITQMGFDVATRLQLCTIGRATNKHFLCYTAPERLQLDPTLAVGGVQKVANA
jgi:formate dehydrogenase accessory protein FdhD